MSAVLLRWQQQRWEGTGALLVLQHGLLSTGGSFHPLQGSGREQPEQGTESRRQVCELERSWQGVRYDQAQCLGVDSTGLRLPASVSLADMAGDRKVGELGGDGGYANFCRQGSGQEGGQSQLSSGSWLAHL